MYCDGNFDDPVSLLSSLPMKVLNNCVISCDTNAKSSTWNAHNDDARGGKFDDFLILNNLVCINDRNQGPTYIDNAGHSSFIDATFCSSSLSSDFVD